MMTSPLGGCMTTPHNPPKPVFCDFNSSTVTGIQFWARAVGRRIRQKTARAAQRCHMIETSMSWHGNTQVSGGTGIVGVDRRRSGGDCCEGHFSPTQYTYRVPTKNILPSETAGDA